MQKRLNEIIERKSAIKTEVVEADETRMTELETELTALEAEETELRKKLDIQARIKNDVVGGKEMNVNEERAKRFAESGKTEMRAVLGTGRIAKPTEAAGVNELADIAADIVDDVNAVSLTGKGAYVVGYKKTDAIAAAVTDGSAIGGTASTYDYVTINPAEWGVLDQVSNQVKKLTNVDYMTAVEKTALIALRAEASNKIVAAIQASALAEAVTVAMDQDYLKNLVLGFRSIKTKGGVCLYLSQADLITLGKVRGTNEKKALFEIILDEGSVTSGTIKEGGLAVKFRVLDSLTAGTQLFGQPKAVDMPMWDNYEISTDEGGQYFAANQIGVRGLQTAGVDLVAYHAFQIVSNQ